MKSGRILIFLMVLFFYFQPAKSQNWVTILHPDYQYNFDDILVTDDSVIYLAANNWGGMGSAEVLSSEDHFSFNSLLSFTGSKRMQNIAMDGEGHFYFSITRDTSTLGEIYRSTDTLASFSPVLTDSLVSGFIELDFTQGVGYAAVNRCISSSDCTMEYPVLYRRPKSDSLWRSQSVPLDKLSGMQVIDSLKLYVWSHNGKILRTTDKGATWDSIMAPVSSTASRLDAFYMQSDSVGYCALNDWDVYRTSDSGKSWQAAIPNYFTSPISSISGKGQFVIIGTGFSSDIVYSQDNGKNWILDMRGAPPTITSIAIKTFGVYMAAVSGVVIYHDQSVFGDPMSAREGETRHPYINIYPNPTKGNLWLSSDKITSYEVLNSAGKMVLKGIAEGRNLDVSQLPAGIYFLQCRDVDGIDYLNTLIKN